jgi:hypothetical protein
MTPKIIDETFLLWTVYNILIHYTLNEWGVSTNIFDFNSFSDIIIVTIFFSYNNRSNLKVLVYIKNIVI